MHDPLATAQTERAHLRRQVMIGYALYHPEDLWNGVIYQRLSRARDALEDVGPTHEVVLVHATGTLYYQSSGDAISQVLRAGGATVHLPVGRHQRRVRDRLKQENERRRRAAAAPMPRARANLRGFTHTPYID